VEVIKEWLEANHFFKDEAYYICILYSAMNIFLVEDDEIYSEFVRKALSQNPDYKITPFFTAEDALKAINGKLPDVLIVDYKLPGMSGIDFYEKIKPQIKDAANRVIMLSALDDGNMVLSFIQKGVRDYVIKDENVIDSLESILAGNDDDFLFN
jgi:DNA-binding NarL/FixJ family response regulator